MPNISEYLNSVDEPCVFIQHEDGRQESMFKSVYEEIYGPIEGAE